MLYEIRIYKKKMVVAKADNPDGFKYVWRWCKVTNYIRHFKSKEEVFKKIRQLTNLDIVENTIHKYKYTIRRIK